MNLEADLVLQLAVECGEPVVIGDTAAGFRRVIPILGGSFSGSGSLASSSAPVGDSSLPDSGSLQGRILSGGADWNTRHPNGITHVFAKYTLQTDDGICIGVENEGWFDRNQAPALIRTSPHFQVEGGSRYGWLASGVYVASLKRRDGPAFVMDIEVYRLR